MVMRTVSWVALVAAFVLSGSPGSEARSKRREARPFALFVHSVDFSSDTHLNRRSRGRSFDGYETHTLEFDVYHRGRSDIERPTQVKLYLPNGDLYGAVDAVPFEDTGAKARRRRAAPVATARVRVSGTVITGYGLYGEWRADVCWEIGSETTCRAGVSFEIR